MALGSSSNKGINGDKLKDWGKSSSVRCWIFDNSSEANEVLLSMLCLFVKGIKQVVCRCLSFDASTRNDMCKIKSLVGDFIVESVFLVT